MKSTYLFFLPLALLSACKAPQLDSTSLNSSTTSPSSSVVALSPVVQITEYQLAPDGETTVKLNGTDLRVNWRLRNTYTYDNQKRLTSQRSTFRNNSSWWEQLSFQYTPDLVQRYQTSDNKDILTNLLLNEKGYIKGNLEPDEYKYDSQGYLTSYKGNGQQDTYTIKDGNLVNRETVYSSGGVQRNTYEYDLSKASIPYPFTFRGRQSQYLLKKQTLVSSSVNSSISQTTIFNCYYDFDSQGRPIREFVVADSESTPRSVREFVYQ